MSRDQNNQKPKNNVNPNVQNEQLFNDRNMNLNSNLSKELDKMKDKNNVKTEKGDNNSSTNSLKKDDSQKIILDSKNNERNPSVKKAKKKKEKREKSTQNSKEMNLNETDDENDELSNDTISKNNYSKAESNNRRKNKNKNLNKKEIENTETTQEFTGNVETKFINYVYTKYIDKIIIKSEENIENINDLKEDIIEINNNTNISSNIVIKKELNHLKIKTPNTEFNIPCDILYESEIKVIIEYILSKFIKSLIKYTRLRGKETFGFDLKFLKVSFSINLDKPEEILTKKIIDLFIGPARKEIDLLLKIENENKNPFIFKKLNILFNKNVEEIFEKYLKDEYINIINDGLDFKFEEFETFETNFKDYEAQKKDIKKIIYLFFKIENPEQISETDNIGTQQNESNFFDYRKLITNQIVQSIHNVNNNYSLDKCKKKLFTPTTKYLVEGYKVENYKTFFRKNIKYIYSDIRPKKISDELKEDKKRKEYYEEPINEVSKSEKKLDLLNNYGKIYDIAKAYILDKKFIEITYKNGKKFKLYLINFKTYKDCFEHLEQDLFDRIRNDYIKLINGVIPSRERGEKKDLSVTENEFLQKKKKF